MPIRQGSASRCSEEYSPFRAGEGYTYNLEDTMRFMLAQKHYVDDRLLEVHQIVGDPVEGQPAPIHSWRYYKGEQADRSDFWWPAADYSRDDSPRRRSEEDVQG